MLLELGYRVTGYDISVEMLNLARVSLGDSVTLSQNLPDIQKSWPLIISLGVLDYYPNTAPLWQQWRQLLASQGVLVVSAPNASSPLAWLYALVSRFTCPAYPAVADRLITAAGQASLTMTELRAAFPGHPRLGHTLVLRLRAAY